MPNRVSNAEYESRWESVEQLFPLSQAALEILVLLRNHEADTQTFAAIILRDVALTTEVLRLGNCSFYKPASRKITDVQEAINFVGCKRVCELAVAMSAMGSINEAGSAGQDRELAWQRSLAGGIAASRILNTMRRVTDDSGLVLSAAMYPLGRFVMAKMFPAHYRAMREVARRDRRALRHLERELFPESNAASMVRLLGRWHVPTSANAPLALAAEEFSCLRRISEPMRTNVLLMKTAIIVGQLAVENWLPWDLVDFPSAVALNKLGILNVGQIVQQVRDDVATLNVLDSEKESNDVLRRSSTPHRSINVAYRSLSPEPFDFLANLLPSIGCTLRSPSAVANETNENTIINCLNVRSPCAAARTGPRGNGLQVLIVDDETFDPIDLQLVVVQVPAAVAALREACQNAALSGQQPLKSAPVSYVLN